MRHFKMFLFQLVHSSKCDYAEAKTEVKKLGVHVDIGLPDTKNGKVHQQKYGLPRFTLCRLYLIINLTPAHRSVEGKCYHSER